MLSVIRNWYAGNQAEAAEPPPLCFVVAADDLLRERITGMVAELGPRAEKFSDVAGMLAASQAMQPDLIYLDLAFGPGVVEAAIGLAGLDKRPALALVNAGEAKTYEQICAVGQAKLAIDRAGLRALPMLQPPVSADAIRRGMQDAGLRCNTGKTAITLDQALKNDWLELFYQPKIHLASNRLVGAEGLICVRHPELGVLPPAAFLPGAREKDMLKLTEQVIVTALRDYDDLAFGGVVLKLSVNTPVSALTTLPIARMLQEDRPSSANWPGLILEVTEDEIVNDLALATMSPTNCARIIAASHRRLRRGLFLAVAASAIAVQRAQDRPLLRHQLQRRSHQRRPVRDHRGVGASLRAQHGRRGNRNGPREPQAARARLRHRPGLSVCKADVEAGFRSDFAPASGQQVRP